MVNDTKVTDIKSKFQHHEKDTGSSEVQVINLTARINSLIGHFKVQPKDMGSKRGLTKLVSQRRKFLDYVKRNNENLYRKLIESLGIRK